MTGKERVKRCIHFSDPDRLAYNFDSNRSPLPLTHTYGEDFIWCFLDKNKDHVDINAQGDKVDEWGCVWKTMGETFGEPTTFPLEEKETFEDVVFPDFLKDERYQSIRKTVAENTNNQYVLGMLPSGIFQIMIHLFGFTDFMMQVAGNTEEFTKLATRLNDYIIQVVDKMADCGVDGIILIEDMGLQDRMMISPRHWKEIYAPLYKKMFAVAHARGLDVFSHTCGHIVDILDMYIDCGLDVIQFDQQDNMGLELLSQRFRGKVCFFCSLDIQTTVHEKDPKVLKEKAKNMTALLCTEHGGFMSKTYPQPNAIHITHEYMQAMTEGFKDAAINYKNICTKKE